MSRTCLIQVLVLYTCKTGFSHIQLSVVNKTLLGGPPLTKNTQIVIKNKFWHHSFQIAILGFVAYAAAASIYAHPQLYYANYTSTYTAPEADTVAAAVNGLQVTMTLNCSPKKVEAFTNAQTGAFLDAFLGMLQLFYVCKLEHSRMIQLWSWGIGEYSN